LILRTFTKFGENNCKRSAFASLALALAAGLPRQDHVYFTTNESFRFQNKKFHEMRFKLDFTENPRSFEKYPIQRHSNPTRNYFSFLVILGLSFVTK